MAVVFRQYVREAHQIIESYAVMQLWLAHISINKQHPLPDLRQSFRQKHIYKAFTFHRD